MGLIQGIPTGTKTFPMHGRKEIIAAMSWLILQSAGPGRNTAMEDMKVIPYPKMPELGPDRRDHEGGDGVPGGDPGQVVHAAPLPNDGPQCRATIMSSSGASSVAMISPLMAVTICRGERRACPNWHSASMPTIGGTPAPPSSFPASNSPSRASHGSRSVSVSGTPAAIFCLLAAGWKASPSKNGMPSRCPGGRRR